MNIFSKIYVQTLRNNATGCQDTGHGRTNPKWGGRKFSKPLLLYRENWTFVSGMKDEILK